jgi:hypothetical protein
MAKLMVKDLKPGDWLEDQFGIYHIARPPYFHFCWHVMGTSLDGFDKVFLQGNPFWRKNKEEMVAQVRIDISTLKRGEHITDGYEYYSVYAEPQQVDGVWQVDTTDDGDRARMFKEGAVIWRQTPAWITRAREESKAKKLSEQL